VRKQTLGQLLEKNAYTKEGLTIEEHTAASLLIMLTGTINGRESCWLCGQPAIEDTGLCRGHAQYALATRK